MLRRIANIIIMTTLLIGPALLLNYASTATNTNPEESVQHIDWADHSSEYAALATPR